MCCELLAKAFERSSSLTLKSQLKSPDEQQVSRVRRQPPCWPVYSNTAADFRDNQVDTRGPSPLSLSSYTNLCMCVLQGGRQHCWLYPLLSSLGLAACFPSGSQVPDWTPFLWNLTERTACMTLHAPKTGSSEKEYDSSVLYLTYGWLNSKNCTNFTQIKAQFALKWSRTQHAAHQTAPSSWKHHRMTTTCGNDSGRGDLFSQRRLHRIIVLN